MGDQSVSIKLEESLSRTHESMHGNLELSEYLLGNVPHDLLGGVDVDRHVA